MKRAMRAALFGLTSCFAALGCNLIIGNDVHELDRDASSATGGATGTGASGGQGGTAGQGGGQAGTAGQGGAGQGGAAGQGGTTTAGAAGQGGAAGGNAGGQAGSAGRGATAGQGGAAGQGASAGRDAGDDGSAGTVNRDASPDGDADAPTPDLDAADAPIDASCSTPGATECRGRSVFLCINGMWIETQKCPYACVVNVCSGNCVPGSTQCIGNTPQTCDATGTWQSSATCPFVCVQGACTGMCVPGSTVPCGDPATCNDGAVQTCDVNGVLGPCNPAPANCEIIPAGWQPVAKPAGACPSGFDWPQTVYTSATGAPYTCTCGCSGSQACEGSATLNESTSCAGQVTSTRTLYFSTTCSSDNGYVVAGYGYSLSDIVFEPTPACFANPTPTTQPPAQTTTMTLCTPSLTCPSGACLSTGQAANLCISKQGIETCPMGYPNGTTYAPWYDDTRTCGACTCGSGLSCSLTDVLLDNTGNCVTQGHPYWMNVSASCATAGNNYPTSSIKANATAAGDPTCVEKTPSNPMGGVELNQGTISTVCCK